MLSKEEDNMPAILSINPGAGGTESQTGQKCLCECILCGVKKMG